MRKCLVAAAGVLAAATIGSGLFGAAAGASGKPREPTAVSVRFNDDSELVGKVKSVPVCESGRKLALIRDSEMMGREVEAWTLSMRGGRYSFGQRLFQIGAEYTVEAEPRERARVVCKAGEKRVPLR